MKVLLLLLALLLKNAYCYILLEKYKVRLVFMLIGGFVVLVLSMFVITILSEKSSGGVIAMVFNMDFFLLLFGTFLKLYLWLFNRFINRSGTLTSPLSFFEVKIPLRTFYIAITVVQVALLLLAAKAAGWY